MSVSIIDYIKYTLTYTLTLAPVFSRGTTYVYDGKWTIDAWYLQPQHKLQLGHQDVHSSCCGEARHQSIRQVHSYKAHLQNAHGKLRGRGKQRKDELSNARTHFPEHRGSVMQSEIYLENPHEEGDRRGHQDSLLVLGQTLKVCDVGRRSVLWYQAGHHSPHHQAQDWEGACRKAGEKLFSHIT